MLTARQQQLDTMLYLRLYPLRRLLQSRLDAMYAEPDADLFDEEEFVLAARQELRVEGLIARVSSRLPAPAPLLDAVEDEQQPAHL